MAKEKLFAFPAASERYVEFRGMSLRDYFAAKAMAAVLPALAEREQLTSEGHPTYVTLNLARLAYIVADAMLEVRTSS